MGAPYQFVSRWFVPAPVEEVYDIMGEQLAYPDWWGEVFLQVMGDKGPPRPGRRASVLSRGFLPYRLTFDTIVTEAERPKRIRMTLAGDFSGGGEWTFESVEGGTEARLDWRPEVNKPFIRYLTPILKPLFRKNHYWAMARGQESILRMLEQRQAAREKESLGSS